MEARFLQPTHLSDPNENIFLMRVILTSESEWKVQISGQRPQFIPDVTTPGDAHTQGD